MQSKASPAHAARWRKRSASKEENVRVICPFVGGGFGCKGSVWSHVVLAAMAAK
ncbi:MAG: Periplasmic aromatic aldehyde oxidoreductase, molybdenum binding subunit YagR [Candidatus Burkholderia crenata]|nr:MAG: Periplasmic aromatic aldehyde oxidoreductase, molybdenum binding subunit YagR [Candidatus Burkholderia crenata]